MDSIEIKPRYTLAMAEIKQTIVDGEVVGEEFEVSCTHVPLGMVTLQQLPNLFDIDITVMQQPPRRYPKQNRAHFYYLR